MQIQFKQRSLKLAVTAAIVLFAASGTASAATATSNMPISASVAASCSIDASTGVAFGAYDPAVANATTALDQTGTISTTCTSGAAVAITLGQGANADTTNGSTDAAPLRRMSDGQATPTYMSYQLYSDSGRTSVWNNDTTGDVPVTGTGTAVSTTVYGRIPAGQTSVIAGSYTDTVVATVTF